MTAREATMPTFPYFRDTWARLDQAEAERLANQSRTEPECPNLEDETDDWPCPDGHFDCDGWHVGR
jgi:hypothetical protein